MENTIEKYGNKVMKCTDCPMYDNGSCVETGVKKPLPIDGECEYKFLDMNYNMLERMRQFQDKITKQERKKARARARKKKNQQTIPLDGFHVYMATFEWIGDAGRDNVHILKSIMQTVHNATNTRPYITYTKKDGTTGRTMGEKRDWRWVMCGTADHNHINLYLFSDHCEEILHTISGYVGKNIYGYWGDCENEIKDFSWPRYDLATVQHSGLTKEDLGIKSFSRKSYFDFLQGLDCVSVHRCTLL